MTRLSSQRAKGLEAGFGNVSRSSVKVPFHIRCMECGETTTVEVNLDDHAIDGTAACGHYNHGLLDVSFTVGTRLLARARHEFAERDDYSMAIVFSAMAVDCALSRAYFKHAKIAGYQRMEEIPDADIEAEVRKLGGIRSKIEAVFATLGEDGLRGFFGRHQEIAEIVRTNFPSLSCEVYAQDVERELFWRRNRIVHFGEARLDRDVAIRCLNIATLTVEMIDVLDRDASSDRRPI